MTMWNAGSLLCLFLFPPPLLPASLPTLHQLAELVVVELVVAGQVERLEGGRHLLHGQVLAELLELLKPRESY